jgi:aspartate carbamoyltransferase regulatory subunit
MAQENIMEVRKIENGTVIDHIPSEALFQIIKIMGLDGDLEHRMTIGINLESKLLGSKAIIKINDRYLAPEEIDRIALVAPDAMVNTIRGYAVVEKRQVTVPSHIEGFVRCANPMCVTNHQPIETAFEVVQRGGELALRCRYCEKLTTRAQMKIKK